MSSFRLLQRKTKQVVFLLFDILFSLKIEEKTECTMHKQSFIINYFQQQFLTCKIQCACMYQDCFSNKWLKQAWFCAKNTNTIQCNTKIETKRTARMGQNHRFLSLQACCYYCTKLVEHELTNIFQISKHE